jgi:GNAT superfamily N-acetyltransferase
MNIPVQIKEVITKKELKKFVKFPFQLYKNNPYWVPPILKEELENFNPELNPVFDHSEAKLFLAYKENKPVGRVAAIINHYEVDKQQVKKMRFGWFDVVDDIAVSRALLDKVQEIGKQNNLEFVEGPLGFSNLDKVGVLTKGYNHIGTMITWYNHPYYVSHLEQLGYVKSKEWLEHYFDTTNMRMDYYKRMSDVIKKRYKLRELNFKSTKEVLPYVDKIFALFEETYKDLASFVPISERQIAYFKKKYIPFIDPEFIKYIEDEKGNTIAFAITMPSFSKALQKAKGHLFPFGIIPLLKAKKNPKEVLFYLIGVHPDYQKKGVVFVLFDAYAKTYHKKGIVKAIRTPELETNTAINAIWKDFDTVNHKRRRTYRKDIE